MSKYLVFATVAVPVFMGQASGTAIAVAFPTMVSHFGISLVLAGWILSIYQVTVICSIPIVSRLSDTLGRRSTFLLCLTSFTAGSIFCAFAPNVGLLILARVIQAIGGGGFTSSAVGIINDYYPGERQRYVGLMTAIVPFGAIVGPNIGSVMVHYFSWQSIFWLNVPISVAAFVLVRRLIKADVKKATKSGIDFPSIGLLFGFVATFMVGMTLLDKSYNMSLFAIAGIEAVALLFMIAFVYRCAHSPGAVISMDLLAKRPFMAANAYNFAFGMCAQSGVLSLMPLFASTVYGMSVIEAGFMITPRAIGMIFASIVASIFIMKWGYRRPMLVGSVSMAGGLILMALEPQMMTIMGVDFSPMAIITTFGLIIGIGAGMSAPAANNACIELMPEKIASITGLRQVVRQIGGAMGIAISTLILSSASDMGRGFTIVFMMMGILVLLIIPAIFLMPANPNSESSSTKKAEPAVAA